MFWGKCTVQLDSPLTMQNAHTIVAFSLIFLDTNRIFKKNFNHVSSVIDKISPSFVHKYY